MSCARRSRELQTAEFLYEARLFPDVEYTFKHALTHEVAYGGVLQERRRALHAAILEALERLHADRLGEHVEVLAHHAVRAGPRRQGRPLPARGRARRRSRAPRTGKRSASSSARWRSSTELPQTPQTLSDALDVRIALGPPLIAVHGSTAPPVEASYLAALDLVERLDDASRRFPVLWGLWYVRSRGAITPAPWKPASDCSRRAGTVTTPGSSSRRTTPCGRPSWRWASSKRALPHIERGIALYDRERHGAYASLYGGHDPGACCRNYLALTQWTLGYPERALATAYEASRLAETLGHAMTSAVTLWFVTFIQYQRGEWPAAVGTAERSCPSSRPMASRPGPPTPPCSSTRSERIVSTSRP